MKLCYSESYSPSVQIVDKLPEQTSYLKMLVLRINEATKVFLIIYFN
jgi:hypothetical protein